jgi:hypothetical protein
MSNTSERCGAAGHRPPPSFPSGISWRCASCGAQTVIAGTAVERVAATWSDAVRKLVITRRHDDDTAWIITAYDEDGHVLDIAADFDREDALLNIIMGPAFDS